MKRYFKHFLAVFISIFVLAIIYVIMLFASGSLNDKAVIDSIAPGKSPNTERTTDERVFDYADVLTDAEEDALRDLIAKTEPEIQCDIVLVTMSDARYASDNAMMNFADDFYDVQATLVEFEEHCDNILSDNFNKVGIGIALNDMKVVVVDIFLKREVTVDSCSINGENGSIILKGELTNEQYGAYALRIISPSAPNKTIVHITPQHITPANISTKIRPFTAVFNNVGKVLEDPEPKNIEIYIRVKPDLIPYNKIFSDKIRFEDLTLGAVIPLMPFPSDRERKEEKSERKDD